MKDPLKSAEIEFKVMDADIKPALTTMICLSQSLKSRAVFMAIKCCLSPLKSRDKFSHSAAARAGTSV